MPKRAKANDEFDSSSDDHPRWLNCPTPTDVEKHFNDTNYEYAFEARLNGFEQIIITHLDSNKTYKPRVVRCPKCFSFFRCPGGHLTRHRSTCGMSRQGPTSSSIAAVQIHPTTKTDVKNAISTYIIESGDSISKVNSPSFRKMIATVMSIGKNCSSDEVDDLIPKRDSVRRAMKKEIREIQENIKIELEEPLKAGTVGIQLDYGRLHYDFFCVKAVIVVEDSYEWKYKVLPLAVRPVFESAKSADDMKKLVEEICENYGFSTDDVEKCVLTGDGASSIKRLGRIHFAEYVRCLSHMCNLVSEHALSPYKKQLPEFRTDELKVLDQYSEYLKHVVTVTGEYTKNTELKHKLKLNIAQPVLTRWFSQFDTLKKFCQSIDVIVGNKTEFSSDVQKILDHLNSPNTRKNLSDFIELIKPLQDICVHSQKDDCVIGDTLTVLARLVLFYKDEESKSDTEAKKVLCKSLILSLITNIKDLRPIHCLATILTPARKNCDEIQEIFDNNGINIDIMLGARKCLDDFKQKITIPSVEKIPKRASKSPTVFETLMRSDSLTDLRKTSIEIEFDRYLASDITTEVKTFWLQHKLRYPNLYVIAQKVFSSAASQASTERSFSLMKSVFRKNRFNLDPEFLEDMLVAYEKSKNE